MPFETAIIERYRRRETSIEEALIVMYLAEVSVRRVEDITEALWGTRVNTGKVNNVAVLAAIAVNQDGFREVLGCVEGTKEDKESWLNFLRHLKERGLKRTQLFISDKCLGLVEALGEIFPQAQWQRCIVHFYRNVFSVTPRGKMQEVAAMLKAIHAQEDKAAAIAKADDVVKKLEGMKLSKAAETVYSGIGETLAYMDYRRAQDANTVQ